MYVRVVRETIDSSVSLAPFGVDEADPRARKSARLSGKLLAAPAFEFSGAAKDGARQAAASKTDENSLKNGCRKMHLRNRWTVLLRTQCPLDVPRFGLVGNKKDYPSLMPESELTQKEIGVVTRIADVMQDCRSTEFAGIVYD